MRIPRYWARAKGTTQDPSGKPFLTPGQVHWLSVMYTIAARTRRTA